MKHLKVFFIFAGLFMLVFAANATASGQNFQGTDTISFLAQDNTEPHRAVHAHFLAWQANVDDSSLNVDTAISVSNVTAAPPEVAGLGIGEPASGRFTVYLWDADGTLFVHTTGPDTPFGNGTLNADGTLDPGKTYTVRLAELLEAITGEDEVDILFTGYGWVVSEFDGLGGTYNVTIFGLGFTQNFEFLPGMGQGGMFGGAPVAAGAASQ
jgi:hypothetical protein